MLVKIISLFLVGMGVLALFGKLRVPKWPGRAQLAKPKTCKSCGAPRIGKTPCPCGNKS